MNNTLENRKLDLTELETVIGATGWGWRAVEYIANWLRKLGYDAKLIVAFLRAQYGDAPWIGDLVKSITDEII